MISKKQFFIFLLAIMASVTIFSCAKEEAGPAEEPVVINRGSFMWKLASGTTVNADSAHFYSQFTTIYAFKNGSGHSISMSLSALSVGTYSFSSATGNVFNYENGPTNVDASSGSCVITSSPGSKLSGNFNVAFAGSPVGSISGNFTDILKK